MDLIYLHDFSRSIIIISLPNIPGVFKWEPVFKEKNLVLEKQILRRWIRIRNIYFVLIVLAYFNCCCCCFS